LFPVKKSAGDKMGAAAQVTGKKVDGFCFRGLFRGLYVSSLNNNHLTTSSYVTNFIPTSAPFGKSST
jgi:hypothetical protein